MMSENLKKYNNERRAMLAAVAVEFPVQSVEQARDPKILEWCTTQLTNGVDWEVLRRKLGLGPAHVDARWREIRKHIMAQAMPESIEDSLRLYYDEQAASIEEMRAFIAELDAKIDEEPENKEAVKAQHQFYRYKLDALSKILDERTKKVQQFLEVKKVKMGVAKHIGVQIIVQNNIPRPQRNEKLVSESQPVIEQQEVLECKTTQEE